MPKEQRRHKKDKRRRSRRSESSDGASGSRSRHERRQKHKKLREPTPEQQLARRHRLRAHSRTRSGDSPGRSSPGPASVSQISEAIAAGFGKLAEQVEVRETRQQVSGIPLSTAGSIIAEFDPLENDVDEWLESIGEYAQIYNWDDRTTCHLALSKLRGPAQTWYRTLPSRVFTWPEWHDILLRNFPPKRDLHKAIQMMMAYTPEQCKTLYEYTFNKLALINKLKLNINPADRVNLITGGICDEKIKFSVQAAGITAPIVLAGHLKTIDDRVLATQSATRHVSHIPATRAPVSSIYRTPKQTSSLPRNDTGNKPVLGPTCFNCGKSGHFRRFCPGKNQQTSSQ